MTDGNKERTKLVALTVKLLPIILPALAGSIGSWYTSRQQSRNDLEAGYKALAETTKDLERAVKTLQDNEARLWAITVQRLGSPEAPSQPEPTPVPPRARPVRGSAGSMGRGSGSASASVRPIVVPPPSPPKRVDVQKVPDDLNAAIQQSAK